MNPGNMIMTGDVNLMNVTDPAVPFAQVADEFRNTDMVFSNLECCLYETPAGHSVRNEGFFADPKSGKALTLAGIQVVGIANNVHYGEAAILSSIARLDELGVLHTGAGANLAAARAPVVVERTGVRYGFLQRSSVYWPTNHEAQTDAAASRQSAATPPITCRCSRPGSGCRRPIGPALRRRSSLGPMQTTCAGSARILQHCDPASTCWWRRAIGGSARRSCNT